LIHDVTTTRDGLLEKKVVILAGKSSSVTSINAKWKVMGNIGSTLYTLKPHYEA
jgi:hypothetical protein